MNKYLEKYIRMTEEDLEKARLNAKSERKTLRQRQRAAQKEKDLAMELDLFKSVESVEFEDPNHSMAWMAGVESDVHHVVYDSAFSRHPVMSREEFLKKHGKQS